MDDELQGIGGEGGRVEGGGDGGRVDLANRYPSGVLVIRRLTYSALQLPACDVKNFLHTTCALVLADTHGRQVCGPWRGSMGPSAGPWL